MLKNNFESWQYDMLGLMQLTSKNNKKILKFEYTNLMWKKISLKRIKNHE